MAYDPTEDGKTHINMYSRGQTEVGRLLSHFQYSPFTHPEFGDFNCVEGFWYYLSTGCQHEDFRRLVGIEAKLHGKTMPRVKREDFEVRIREANRCKLEQFPYLRDLFITSTLPLDHYYLIRHATKQIYPKGCEWLVTMFEELRTELRGLYGQPTSPSDLHHGAEG